MGGRFRDDRSSLQRACLSAGPGGGGDAAARFRGGTAGADGRQPPALSPGRRAHQGQGGRAFPHLRPPWFVEAPLVLAVVAVPGEAWRRIDDKPYDEVDATIAMDHLILAAASLGLGTCWVAAFDPAAAREVLGLPDEVEPLALHAARLSSGPGAPQGAPLLGRARPVRALVRGGWSRVIAPSRRTPRRCRAARPVSEIVGTHRPSAIGHQEPSGNQRARRENR